MSRWICVITGLIVSAGAVAAQPQLPPPPLPLKVDLEPEFHKLGLHVHDQLNRDVCTLFAITGLSNFEYAKKTPGATKQFSEEYLVWAANAATGLTDEPAMFYEAVHGLNQ